MAGAAGSGMASAAGSGTASAAGGGMASAAGGGTASAAGGGTASAASGGMASAAGSASPPATAAPPRSGDPVVQIDVSIAPCAVTASGRVACWGAPLGAANKQTSPVFVRGITDAVEVKRRCARRRAGSVVCWDHGFHVEPMPGSEGTRALVVGEGTESGYEVCAITAARTVACAGPGGTAFAPVDGLADVAWLSEPVWDYRCAALGNGHAVCIGRVRGLAQDADLRYELPGVSDAVAAFPYADDIACAVNRAGAMTCAGKGMEPAHGRPPPPRAATQLFAQECLRRGGDIECYVRGRVGRDARWVHQDVGGPATDLSCEGSTCCAVVGGAAKCWGDNRLGQLGDGFAMDGVRPTKVAGLPPIASVQAGDEFTLALARSGEVYLWGWGMLDGDRPRQIGRAAALVAWAREPVVVDGVTVSEAHDNADAVTLHPLAPLPAAPISFAQISDDRCAALVDGSVRCYDSDKAALAGLPPDRGTWWPVRALRGVAALDDDCALLNTGAVECFWGGDHPVRHPIAIRGIARARRVSNRLIELAGDSYVRADVDDHDRWTVVKLPQLHALADIHRSRDAGGNCAIQAGRVMCWQDDGVDRSSLLGRDPAAPGDLTAPAPLSPGVAATALSVGKQHACAIDVAGAVWCWGDDHSGATGAGHASFRGTPSRVAGIGI